MIPANEHKYMHGLPLIHWSGCIQTTKVWCTMACI